MTTPPRPAVDRTRVVQALRSANGVLDPGSFTYTVLIDATPQQKGGTDRREAPRRRTRLRSGKIVDAEDFFVTECLVHDLSESGMRLRVPAAVALPSRFQVYDDHSGRLQGAEVTWRRADEAGIRFVPLEETPRSRTVAADMRRKFYKMPR